MKGELIPIGRFKTPEIFGMSEWEDYVECMDCNTRYRIVQGKARCNGSAISSCPFCEEEK